MAEDAETALTEVQGGYVSAGYLTTSIVLMHEDQEQLQDWKRGSARIQPIVTPSYGVPWSTR